MNRSIASGIMFTAALYLMGCSAVSRDDVVELKDIQFFRAIPQEHVSGPRLRVSGLVFESATSVSQSPKSDTDPN